MAFEYRVVRRVEFSETDLAGIMHFSNFFRYMEAAEHAFFRSLGCSIHSTVNGKTVGWPRVHAECEYRRPLCFEDEVEIHLLVRKVRSKAIEYAFVFRKLNSQPVEVAARGALTVVCGSHTAGQGGMKAIRIPAGLAGKLKAAPKACFSSDFTPEEKR